MQIRRLERKDEKDACDYADRIGLLHIKMNTWGSNGWPDRQFLPKGGNAFFIEFKRKGEKPRPLQIYRREELVKRGYHVYTCYSAQEAVQVIRSETVSKT